MWRLESLSRYRRKLRCTNCGYFEPYSMERRKKIYELLGLEDPLSDWYEEDNK